jgi:hypothetical protein
MRLKQRLRVPTCRRRSRPLVLCLALVALVAAGRPVAAQEIPANTVPANDAGSSDNAPLVPANQPITPDYPSVVPQDQGSSLPGASTGTVTVTPNSATTNAPLTPYQGVNLFNNYSSPYNPAQQSLLVAPQLYNTGAYDLSQVTANAALASAFTQSTAAAMFGQNILSSEYAPIQRIRVGPVDIKTSLSTSAIADDNINATATNKRSDVIFTIAPAVLVQYGDHDGQRGYASLVYAPTFTRYYHESAQDTNNDENVALNLQYPFQRLTLGATESLSQTTGINLDSQARTTQSTSVSAFEASYAVDDRISANGNVAYSNSSFSDPGSASTKGDGSGGNNDSTLSGALGFSYQLSDKISFGPSISYGEDDPSGGYRQTYEQGLIGINYRATEKITLFGQAGIEARQYGGSNSGGSTNPIFSGGVSYTPTDNSGISLSGFRNVESSSGNYAQNDTSTGVSLTLAERLFQRFNVAVNLDYEDIEYSNSQNNVEVRTTPTIVTGPLSNAPIVYNPNGGGQTTYAIRPSVSYSPTEWTAVGLYYQYRDDETDAKSQSYTDNQAGVSLSVQF